MAEALLMLKSPVQENIKQFNKRLREACEDVNVTGIKFTVVDGQPCVVLTSDMDVITQEDIDEAKEMGIPEEELPTLGFLTSDVALCCAVINMRAHELKAVEKTEDHFEKVVEEAAEGDVEEIMFAQGHVHDWIEGPDGKQHFVMLPVNACLVIWQINPQEVDPSAFEEENDDDENGPITESVVADVEESEEDDADAGDDGEDDQ